MENTLIRARLRKVWVEDNGDKDIPDPPKPKDKKALEDEIKELRRKLLQSTTPFKRSRRLRELAQANEALMSLAADNTVQATLEYPRSGESKVVAFRTLALGDGETEGKEFEEGNPAFFDSILFKEEVQGETRLQIEIQDKDPKNPVLRFLRGLAVTLFGNLAKGLLEGISHVVPASAGAQVSESVKSAIKPEKGDEKVHVIAQSERVNIQVVDGGSLKVTNAAPGSDIQYEAGVLTLQLKTPRKVGDLAKGQPNGKVVLFLATEPL